MRKFLIVVALAYACSANAQQQQFDGTWTGTAAQWTLTLKVAGAKARLEIACGGVQGITDFPVGADGVVNTTVSFPSFGLKTQVTGTVRAIQLTNGGSCGSGTATMTKKS